MGGGSIGRKEEWEVGRGSVKIYERNGKSEESKKRKEIILWGMYVPLKEFEDKTKNSVNATKYKKMRKT